MDLVGEEKGLGRVVGDDETGAGKVIEMASEHPTELHPRGYVESRQGLVEKQEVRLDDQCPGQCDPLCLTAGQLWRLSPPETGEVETLQPASGSLHRLVTVDTAAPQPERDILDDRHVREQQVVLEHDTDSPGLRRGSGHLPPARPE